MHCTTSFHKQHTQTQFTENPFCVFAVFHTYEAVILKTPIHMQPWLPPSNTASVFPQMDVWWHSVVNSNRTQQRNTARCPPCGVHSLRSENTPSRVSIWRFSDTISLSRSSVAFTACHSQCPWGGKKIGETHTYHTHAHTHHTRTHAHTTHTHTHVCNTCTKMLQYKQYKLSSWWSPLWSPFFCYWCAVLLAVRCYIQLTSSSEAGHILLTDSLC